MDEIRKIAFKEVCINGSLLAPTGTIKTCEISNRQGRDFFNLTLTANEILDVAITPSLSVFTYSKWDPSPDVFVVLDFKMVLRSIPDWLSIYSRARSGCIHNVQITVKIIGSELSYRGFVGNLRSILTSMRCKSVDNAETLDLWAERCRFPPIRKVKSIQLCLPNFQSFSSQDLDRLTDDRKWLSDSHVTFALQHWFRHYASQNIWGNLKIGLVDTTVWSSLSKNPEKYGDKYRKKLNLLGYDFVVLPMFEVNHWKLGIIDNPGGFLQRKTKFHILDSLANNSAGMVDAKELQKILLKHFKGKKYEEGRIASNLAQVPVQTNTTDCGCFLIYFAKKFLSDPVSFISLVKTLFLTSEERRGAWDLKNEDMTFVRRELRTILFKYVLEGNAVLEYK